MKKGKFIVIDGTDGSGKATQTKLLVGRLKKEGYKVRAIDFPQYYKNFFGKMIGECLVGKYGNFLNVDPHIASVLYAADRWESSEIIKKYLKDGYIVIADRYSSSNQIHQGGKIKNLRKRKEFLEWLEKMEFNIFKIPKPDLIIYLDVPVNVSKNLLQNKKAKNRKKYSNGKKDLSENNLRYANNSKNSAIKLIEEYNNWMRIDCINDNKLMSIEEVGEIVWNNLKKIIK
jgi:dTMP kinase